VAAVPDGMARAVAGVVSALARVPGGYFYTSGFSGGWLLVTYGLVAAWVWRERLGVSRRRLALAALVAGAALVWTGGHRAPAGLRATFLAVGGGNTTLLELPNGRTLLYDAGSSLTYATAAERLTAPALWWRGVDRVDAVFLTHAHFDHFKDVLPLVERFGVRRVFVPPTFLRRRLRVDDAVIEALLGRGVEVTFFGAGDRLSGTGRVVVRGVWPRGPSSWTDEVNDGSLVLEVVEPGPETWAPPRPRPGGAPAVGGDVCGPVEKPPAEAPGTSAEGLRLLLTGDIEPPAIEGLLAAEPGLRAQVVLWPHHGQPSEAVERLFARTGARVAVVSAAGGRGEARSGAGARLQSLLGFHTGREGMVSVEATHEGWRVWGWRSGRRATRGRMAGQDAAPRRQGEAEGRGERREASPPAW